MTHQDVAGVIAELRDRSLELSRQSIDHGCADSGISANLADAAADLLESQAKALSEAKDDNERLNFTFDLQCEADSRAVKAWQAAHPEKQRTRPDRCDMVIWLMEQLAAAESSLAEARRVIEPFATVAAKLAPKWLDYEGHWNEDYSITVGHLRAARDFLNAKEKT